MVIEKEEEEDDDDASVGSAPNDFDMTPCSPSGRTPENVPRLIARRLLEPVGPRVAPADEELVTLLHKLLQAST